MPAVPELLGRHPPAVREGHGPIPLWPRRGDPPQQSPRLSDPTVTHTGTAARALSPCGQCHRTAARGSIPAGSPSFPIPRGTFQANNGLRGPSRCPGEAGSAWLTAGSPCGAAAAPPGPPGTREAAATPQCPRERRDGAAGHPRGPAQPTPPRRCPRAGAAGSALTARSRRAVRSPRGAGGAAAGGRARGRGGRAGPGRTAPLAPCVPSWPRPAARRPGPLAAAREARLAIGQCGCHSCARRRLGGVPGSGGSGAAVRLLLHGPAAGRGAAAHGPGLRGSRLCPQPH